MQVPPQLELEEEAVLRVLEQAKVQEEALAELPVLDASAPRDIDQGCNHEEPLS